jgi:hypothetical protein
MAGMRGQKAAEEAATGERSLGGRLVGTDTTGDLKLDEEEGCGAVSSTSAGCSDSATTESMDSTGYKRYSG